MSLDQSVQHCGLNIVVVAEIYVGVSKGGEQGGGGYLVRRLRAGGSCSEQPVLQKCMVSCLLGQSSSAIIGWITGSVWHWGMNPD